MPAKDEVALDFWACVRADLIANNDARRWLLSSFFAAMYFDTGFSCVFRVRLMQFAWKRGGRAGKVIARVIWRSVVDKYQCYISLESEIGPALVLPHPVGIVIGDGVKIGAGVVLYQHVTLGRANRAKLESPAVGDGSILYAGCVVVGDVEIGSNLYVPANSVLSKKNVSLLRPL